MKDSPRSALYLLAPCLGLGAFAFYLSRRPQAPPPPLLYGPLHFLVQGAETQKTLPIDVYQGYDRRFHLVLWASGARPKWWGQSIRGRSGTEIKNWKFWLEQGGKRTEFKPMKTLFWTTDYDPSKKRYYNEFLLHCGDVPADATLRVSGTTLVDTTRGGIAFKSSIPFEATLKKAGEVWVRPNVPTKPGFLIRKIEIRRLKNGRTVGLVTVFTPPGARSRTAWQSTYQMLDGNWHLHDKPSYFFGLGFAGGSNFTRPDPSERVETFTFQWITASLGQVPDRDLIVTQPYSVSDNWPMEIAFVIKKDGKPVFGIVPPLTRPVGR